MSDVMRVLFCTDRTNAKRRPLPIWRELLCAVLEPSRDAKEECVRGGEGVLLPLR